MGGGVRLQGWVGGVKTQTPPLDGILTDFAIVGGWVGGGFGSWGGWEAGPPPPRRNSHKTLHRGFGGPSMDLGLGIWGGWEGVEKRPPFSMECSPIWNLGVGIDQGRLGA